MQTTDRGGLPVLNCGSQLLKPTILYIVMWVTMEFTDLYNIHALPIGKCVIVKETKNGHSMILIRKAKCDHLI